MTAALASIPSISIGANVVSFIARILESGKTQEDPWLCHRPRPASAQTLGSPRNHIHAVRRTMPRTPFVFVIMPFATEFDDEYELAIKPACLAAGATCERVDEQIFLRSILERIYSEIERADIVVAEMATENANVFYEVGYAHGLGKPVILLTRSVDDIPFDLRQYPHIVHEGQLRPVREKLEEQVRWCIDHPDELKSQTPRYSERSRIVLSGVATHIKNYLTAREFEMVSFERIRTNINPAYSDELLQQLIEAFPDDFRRARLKGGKPGIALVNQ